MSAQEAAGVYPAPTRPRDDPVKFDGPTGFVGPIPGDADMDASTLTMRTGVDAPLAIERLSRDVYQNTSSAPREDLANEMRSASVAAAAHGASPYIRVVADSRSRQFSVQGFDTMGCTWDEFTRALAVIGRTSNRDSALPGQMGMGFYANVLMSDTILFDSHARKTGERFTAMCKGGREWQVGLASAPMPEYGVRVSMTVHAAVKMAEIRDMVRRCALLSPCPVYMKDEGDGGEWRALPMHSSAKSLTRRTLYKAMRGGVSTYDSGARDYGEDEHGNNPLPEPFGAAMRNANIDGAVYLHGQKDGVEVCAAITTEIRTMRVDKKTTKERVIRGYGRTEAYLVGMPIRLAYRSARSGDGDAGPFRDARVITVAVHDERTYRPTADRERFDADAERRICKKIDEILAEQMAAVRWPRTLAEHLRGPYRAMLDAAIDSGSDMGSLKEALKVPPVGPEAAEAARLGRTPVRNGFDRRKMPLYHAVAEHPRAVLASKVDAGVILAVARHDPSMRVIVVGKAVDVLYKSGIETVERYMERAAITPLRGDDLAAYAASPEWAAVRMSYGLLDADDDRLRQAAVQIVYSVAGKPLDHKAALKRERGRIAAAVHPTIVDAGVHLGPLVGAMLVSGAPCSVARLPRDGSGKKRGRRPAVFPLTTDPPADAAEAEDEQPAVPAEIKVISEADLLSAASSMPFATSRGEMTGDEILHHAGRIAIMQCAGDVADRLASAIAGSEWFGRPGTLYVVCGGRKHFALVSLLGCAGGGARGPDGPLPADRIFRVVAMTSLPEYEKRRAMVPAGTPVLLADEMAGCGDPRRARLVGSGWCGWETRMDLFLAALELESIDILAAFATTAARIDAHDFRPRIRDLLDDALAADRAFASGDDDDGGGGSGCGCEPQTGRIADFANDDIDVDNNMLSQAKRWLVGSTNTNINLLRRTTVAEVGRAAAGAKYLTNNGVATADEIVANARRAHEGLAKALADARADGVRLHDVADYHDYDYHDHYFGRKKRIASDILVYDRDAAGLASALPASTEFTVAVVETIDDALELACAIAAAGFRCRIGGKYDAIVEHIMARLRAGDALGEGVANAWSYHNDWMKYTTAWYGLLTVRNRALRALLSASLDNYNAKEPDVEAYGALVERFLWLDGQGNKEKKPAAGAGCDGAASKAVPPTINDTMAPDPSGARKKR